MKKKFVSYAQDFEDWILFSALEDVQNGFYVDVGANDPCVISVTKAFYNLGWSGINIEPLSSEYKKLCLDRSRDINLNIGVGAENTSLEFIIAGTGTTCDPEIAREFKDIVKAKKKMIAIRKLSDVLDEHLKEKDKAIHFCKIDVEGFERSVLEGMDFKKFRPWIIVVEATLPGTSIPCHDKWEDLLLDSKYELGFIYGMNRYYFDKLLDGERIEKIKSGFVTVWDKAAKYELKKTKNFKTQIYNLKCCIFDYSQNHNNFTSKIFRGLINIYRGIRAVIRWVCKNKCAHQIVGQIINKGQ